MIFCSTDILPKKKKHNMRVFGVSDVHSDYDDNMSWTIKAGDNTSDDCILVAGDVSHKESIIKATLLNLKKRFKYVSYTPGNHDLWIDNNDYSNSLEKLKGLMRMCEEIGVITKPTVIEGVYIVPLLSWHHISWDTDPDIVGWEGIVPIEKLMADYRKCIWPDDLDQFTDSVAKHIDELNPVLEPHPEIPIVSYSHFLPYQELCPEKRFLYHPNLPKAVGSNFLKSRVKSIKPTIHLFGHTHLAWDETIDGTRFIQAPLAYPHERDSRPRSLRVGPPEEVEEDHPGVKPHLIWDTKTGSAPLTSAWWSNFYKTTPRDPTNFTELAPYVAKMYRRSR